MLIKAELKKYDAILEEAYNNAKSSDSISKKKHWLDSPWKSMKINPFLF